MGIKETIKNFNKQFGYEPEIIRPEKLNRFNKFIVAGMGGSNLVAELLKIREPHMDIVAHRDYGLPPLLNSEIASRLFIVNSYSGNTEETIDALEKATAAGFSTAVISTGGELIKIADELGLPCVKMPLTDVQPRLALGYNIRAVLKVMGRDDLLKETQALASALEPLKFEEQGKKLAEKLKGRASIIYVSSKNAGIAYNWKVEFNETGKIPAFCNVFPELSHNEIDGFFDGSEKFYFIILKDLNDHPQIKKQMTALEKFYQDRNLPITTIELETGDIFHKIFSSLILADWTAYYIAEGNGAGLEQTSAVKEFKKRVAAIKNF